MGIWPDNVSLPDLIAFGHENFREMRIQALQIQTVVNNNQVAVDSKLPGKNHLAVVRGGHRRAGNGSEVKAKMGLLIHGLAVVNIRAFLSEPGAVGGVRQTLEHAGPKLGRGGVAADFTEFGVIRQANLAVHFQKTLKTTQSMLQPTKSILFPNRRKKS